jgi:hypothetical protein
MKHKNPNQNPDVGLQEYAAFVAPPAIVPMTPEIVSNLELAMTNSAFGYEYALKALEEEGEFGLRSEQLRSEIENLKAAYFEARGHLYHLDNTHLEKFETALQAEKAVLFTKQAYLH